MDESRYSSFSHFYSLRELHVSDYQLFQGLKNPNSSTSKTINYMAHHVTTSGDHVICLPAVKCSGTTLNERLSTAYGLQAASVMKIVLTGRGRSSVT